MLFKVSFVALVVFAVILAIVIKLLDGRQNMADQDEIENEGRDQ